MYAFSSRSRTVLLALLAFIVAVSVGAQVNPHGGGYPAQPNLSIYLPYTGATADLILGAHSVKTTGYNNGIQGIFQDIDRSGNTFDLNPLWFKITHYDTSWVKDFETVITPSYISTPSIGTSKITGVTSWDDTQTFDGGIQVGGHALTDVVPMTSVITGQGTYPLATTHVTGGDLVLAGGAGKSIFTVVDYSSLYGAQVLVTVNERLPGIITYILTEGVEFAAQTSNTVTAANLAAAINGWVVGVYATASGAVVSLETATGATNFRPTSASAAITTTISASGEGYLSGPWHTTGPVNLDGDVVGTIKPWSPGSGVTTLDATNSSFMDISCTGAWSPAAILGATTNKMLVLTFEDVNFSITDGGIYQLNGNFTSTVGATLVLFYTGTQWREISRSLN